MFRKGDYRDLAVFTIAQDEPEFVHPWINHYRKHVAAPRDIYVLLHAATRPDGAPVGSAEAPAWHRAEASLTGHHEVAVQRVHHASAFDHLWLAETVARFQHFLLSSYEWVLFAEIDEFVLPTPGAGSETWATLLELVHGLGKEPPAAVRASGFDVVHQRGELPVPHPLYNDGTNIKLTAGKLLEDRSLWRASRFYSKTLLANVPLRWGAGFHTVKGKASEISGAEPSADLTLVHLHRVDFDLALGRARRSSARKWSQFDLQHGRGKHNRIDDVVALREWWDGDLEELCPIAPGIKAALG